jgi:hypothetical protein
MTETPLAKGMLTFGDFLQNVVVFSLFEKEEIQRCKGRLIGSARLAAFSTARD